MTEVPHERVSYAEPAETRVGHEVRYRIAAGFVRPGELVVDAACGVGYGAPILEARGPIRYLGIERDLTVLAESGRYDGSRQFLGADLNDFTWDDYRSRYPKIPTPAAPDVVVGFETLEHLDTVAAYVGWTSRARLVLISVPLWPTIHINPHHRRDYAREEIEDLYRSAGMRVVSYLWQEAELSGVWVFGRSDRP